MDICIVIGAGECSVTGIEAKKGDLCIAVDNGYAYCKKMGIIPELLIGDMDSLEEGLREDVEKMEMASPEKVIRLCREKDDTDTLAALRLGMERGYREFFIYGAMGGRMEHTIANIQALCYLKNNGARGYLFDDGVTVSILKDETIAFKETMEGYLSLFAMGEKAEGVTITGMKYLLADAEVTNDYPIGISNEFIGEESTVTVKKGMLLLILSRKKNL